VIKSFRDTRTAAIYSAIVPKGVAADVARRARIKLLMVHRAQRLNDLRVPPGNRLESLHGDRAGQHSIRVSGKWRICFVWRNGDAEDVEFCDYH
jgi:toxin HigB-1